MKTTDNKTQIISCTDVRCLCSFIDRQVLADTDALRNPQRQLASDRYTIKHK